MKRKTALRLGAAAAAGVGAAGGLAALVELLYAKCVAAMPYDTTRSDRLPYLQQGREWATRGEGFRGVTTAADDGITLWAAHLPPREESHCWAICAHGYRGCHVSIGSTGLHYAEKGFHVLLPDHRGHGSSGGDHIGWGYEDRLDLMAWVNYIVRRDPDARIVLHGVSMGAAAILMATGGPIRSQVKAAVSDCAFTELEQVMRHLVSSNIRKAVKVPLPVPFGALFGGLRRVTLRKAGYDLRDAAPIKVVGRSKTPTLFIHGGQDDVVPPDMLGKLYEAARCPKEYLWVEQAGHAEALGADPERYWAVVDAFLDKYMAPEGVAVR